MDSEESTSSVAVNVNRRRLCLRNYSKNTVETALSQITVRIQSKLLYLKRLETPPK